MLESLRLRLRRWRYNWLPSYRGSGGWITYLAEDWLEVKVTLPFNRWTRSYVGTIYCGSMYSAIAPFYVAMFVKNLGAGYLVWSKTVTMRFLKPAQTTLYAHMRLEPSEIAAVRAELAERRATERAFTIELTDAAGAVYAVFEEVIYIRRQRDLERASAP